MAYAPFDANKRVTFDLAQGRVTLGEGSGAPALLVPAEALASVCRIGGPSAFAAVGAAIGEPMGERIASRAGGSDALRAEPLETIVDHLGGELALVGLGALAAERWGRALVLAAEHAPFGADGSELLARVLERALSVASGRDLRCVSLGQDGSRARFLVTGPAAAGKVSDWLSSGKSWRDAIARLHEPAKASGEV
jgi:hypothetical protein